MSDILPANLEKIVVKSKSANFSIGVLELKSEQTGENRGFDIFFQLDGGDLFVYNSEPYADLGIASSEYAKLKKGIIEGKYTFEYHPHRDLKLALTE